MTFTKNMGIADRFIRSGVAGILSTLIGNKKKKSTLDYVLLGIGGLLLITSASGKCPAYDVAKVDTLSDAEREKRDRKLAVKDII